MVDLFSLGRPRGGARSLRQKWRFGLLSCGPCLFIALSGLSGCGTASDEPADDAPPPHAGPVSATSLRFDSNDALQLLPGEQKTVVVQASPPGQYKVRFGLLGKPGVPRDASLDRAEATTASDGTVSVVLTAATSATLFTLRASIADKLSAERPVSVSSNGFASLSIRPRYAGDRPIAYFFASVRQGVTCSDLMGTMAPDGTLSGQAAPNESLRLDGIPIGVDLALSVRAGYLASGCADVRDLKLDPTNTIDVVLTDVPLQLDGGKLSLSLTLRTPAAEIAPALHDGIDRVLESLHEGASDDVQSLLTSMREVLGAPLTTTAFDNARTAGSWDLALRSKYGTKAATMLRAPCGAWLEQGLGAFTGSNALAGVLGFNEATPNVATLSLAAVANADAVEAGFSQSNPVFVSTSAGDNVLVQASPTKTGDYRLRFAPSRLVAALALGPARAAHDGAATVAEALADQIDCASIAGTLTATSDSQTAFSGCNAACMEDLCRSALARLWLRAKDASVRLNRFGNLSLNAAGAASVDEYARPTGIAGSWIGMLATASSTTPVGGDVHATAADPSQ